MISPYTREQIENWVGDFCHGDAPREFSTATRELASDILVRFLTAACEHGGTLEELSESSVRTALLGDVARLNLTPAVRAEVPALCASLMSELERQGRLADGRALGAFVRALGGAWSAATGPAKPFVRPGSELSRNDPCPCGSGKKYKKCCLRLLDK